ncbi:Uncharacterised protein [Mycobacteroides abscessus subsp. abscessus]|nr:Uncharacterised protein [Mycobacteroides abscessus subsp. abscessus]
MISLFRSIHVRLCRDEALTDADLTMIGPLGRRTRAFQFDDFWLTLRPLWVPST